MRVRENSVYKIETDLGFHYLPNGVLGEDSMRRIYRPIDHTLRDWMHTLTGDGQANTVIAELLHATKDHGFTVDRVVEFMLLAHVTHVTP